MTRAHTHARAPVPSARGHSTAPKRSSLRRRPLPTAARFRHRAGCGAPAHAPRGRARPPSHQRRDRAVACPTSSVCRQLMKTCLSSRCVAPCTSRARSVLRPCARAVLSKRIETQKHRARVRESAHQHGDSSHGPTAPQKGRRQVAGANEDGSSPGRACAFRWRQGWSEGAADASDREVQRVFTHFTHSSRQKNDLRCDESGACWARERKCRTAARGVLQYSSASR